MDTFVLLGRLFRLLEPERAHGLTLRLLERGWAPRRRAAPDPRLGIRLWDLDFPNPLGLAAGFDKDARAIGPMLGLGFGFVEIGSVTPKPQPGNPGPRVFRLPEDRAVINRLGFPGQGVEVVAARLAAWRSRALPGIVGVNLGKNRESAEPAADYAAGARRLGPLADYLVVNVSSPNTPGLRALQGRAELAGILARVRAALDEADTARRPPLLVKIAPDLAPADLQEIAALAREGALDGLIVGNTTLRRPDSLRGQHREEAGGLSGRPLFPIALEVLAETYRLTEGRVPLIGVGGVSSAEDAYAMIRAGASLVELYTALVYEGPGVVGRITDGLAGLLRRDGFDRPAEAVGSGNR